MGKRGVAPMPVEERLRAKVKIAPSEIDRVRMRIRKAAEKGEFHE